MSPPRFTTSTLLAISALAIVPSAALADTTVNASTLTVTPSTEGYNYADTGSTSGTAKALTGNSSVSWNAGPNLDRISVRAKGQSCSGAARMRVELDGASLGTFSLVDGAWTTYNSDAPAGNTTVDHTVTVSFINDYYVSGGCDRNMALDTIKART